jgi:hypothetical protein
MWHACERREKCKRFWWETPKGKRPLGRQRCSWEDGIKMLRETGWGVYIGFDWLRIGTSGELL